MDANLIIKAYELLIRDLESELKDSYRKLDTVGGREVDITNILLEEIFRLSDYNNLLTVAKQIDKEVFHGKVNYQDFVEVEFYDRRHANESL